MIREAKRADLEVMMKLSYEDHKKQDYILGWDAESVEIQIRNLLLLPSANLFVWEDNGDILGVVGGPMASWPYNLNTSVIQEYMTLGTKIEELRNAFYQWGKNMGAKVVIKLCVDPSDGPRVISLEDR